MGPKEGRRVRKIDVPTDTPLELELGDTVADIQQREREEREAREREEEPQKQRKEAWMEETTHSARDRVAEKHARTGKSDTEMDTEAGEEMGTSQTHSTHKKEHMTNIYLMDTDDEATLDFMMNPKELYDKTNDNFKDKARKECL